MKKIISVLNTITVKSGGLTTVSLTRAKTFLEKGLDSYVVTTDYDKTSNKTIRSMRKMGRIQDGVEVINLYSWYASINMLKSSTDESTARNFYNQVRNKEVTRNKDSDSLQGYSVYTYNDHANNVFLTEILDDNEKLKWGILNLEGKLPLIFSSAKELHTHFLSELTKNSVNTVLISDQPVCCDAVLAVKHAHVFKVLTIHNNHFRDPYKLGSNVNDRYGNIISGMPYADSIVILTKKQKEHILEQYNDRGNLFVISNPLPNYHRDEHHFKSKNKCVAVCRLVPMKNLTDMIDGFIKAHRINQSLTLEIWGDGVLKESLQEYIKNKSADGYIKLMGYTSEPYKIFSEASMSLATSTFEGFGLSFAESLSAGTPVISYKTLYGPEEIISHGCDGFLVDDTNSLSEKILKLRENDELRERMGKNGIINMRRFSNENIIEKWITMFESIRNKGSVNSSAERNSVDFPNVAYNITGSAYGWVYISKGDVEKNRYKLSAGGNVQVIKVYSARGFKGEPNTLLEGDYQIESLEYLSEREDYRFKLRKGQCVYTGPLGMNSLKLRIKE